MGVDITQYRIRIGGFTQPCARAPRDCNNDQYNPCTQGTDVHFRTFICLLFVLGLYAYGHGMLIVQNHALNLIDRNAQTVLPISFLYCTTDVHVSGGPVEYACLYQGFHQRMLSLASDVELNPGPKNGASHGDNTNRPPSPSSFYTGPYMNPDTQYIVNTMAAYNKQTNDSIAVIGAEIQAVRHDMQWVKQELNDMNGKINNIEARQHSMGKHIESMEMKFEDIDIEHQNLRTEFEELAHVLDRYSSDMRDVTKRLETLEGAEIRNSLRIFGLPDDEHETNDQTKLKFTSDIYNVAYPDGSLQGDALIDIKRVGKFSLNTPGWC
jgi:prefoldin subunit 5